MPNDNPHSLLFNLPSAIGSKTRIPILFPEDYEVWALHFADYVLGIEEHGSNIWHAMMVETYKYSGTKKEIKSQDDYNAIIVEHNDIPNNEKDKMICDLKPMRII